MSDMYVECLVKAKQSGIMKVFKVVLIVLAVLSALITMTFFMPIMFVLAIVFGVGAYFLNMLTDLEYEYTYLDKEIAVDKIMAKSRRKKVSTYTLDRMEIFAPINSHRLDSYKNRQVKVKDYSIREVLQPDLRYAMYYEGGIKIILSPSQELLKVLKNAAPRKVFTD